MFVVDQIKKADDMYQQINALMPGQVAIWTTDHDVNSIKSTQMLVPPGRRFSVDQLEEHAIAVVTQTFFRGPRGDRAREVNRKGHKVPRALTIFDEQTKEVEVYDIQQSQAIRVKEIVEKDARYRHTLPMLQPLLAFLHEQSEGKVNRIETPDNKATSWSRVQDLAWFISEEAENFVNANARDIPDLKDVFGFAAQLYRDYAFIFRFGDGEQGTHFLGYLPPTRPNSHSVLLDATADIDKVSEFCSWRTYVTVPKAGTTNYTLSMRGTTTMKTSSSFSRNPLTDVPTQQRR